jgi:protein-L-isoaspartate(D-aspartate) O-methyltransferase
MLLAAVVLRVGRIAALALGVAVLAGLTPALVAAADFDSARAAMVRTIQEHARQAAAALGRDHIADDVLKVMGAVPRHEFVADGLRGDAYSDRPLPIGFGQTISQPFIVALMTDLLRVEPDHTVLEVGTGSGYQAAVLAHLARRVHTIEIVPALADGATAHLRRLGYDRVETRTGDGYYGWEEAAPFDSIMVTAAASHIPPPLVQQLKPGGRMVIPVGAPFTLQHLVLVERDAEGRVKTRQLLPVKFVPLTGGGARR